MADDKSKTKAQLIAELEGLRGELSEARQQVTPRDDASVLKIQLAVERVRAEAMAMRSSDDLLKVLRAMWREMDHLGFERMTTRIGFVDESEGRVRSFLAMDNPTRRGVSWTSSEIRELDDDLVIRIFDRTTSEASDVVDRWRKRDVWTFRMSKVEDEVEMRRTIERDGFDGAAYTPSDHFITDVPFAHGTVRFREKEYNEDHVAIVQQFTKALSLGYLRFLDFQQLEQQAEELKKQAEQARRERAVARVRAEAMVMRSSDDLLNVVGVIFQEMLRFGIVSSSCSIQLVEEEKDFIRVYAAHRNPKKFGLSWTSSDVIEFNEDILVWKGRLLPEGDPRHIEKWREGKVWS